MPLQHSPAPWIFPLALAAFLLPCGCGSTNAPSSASIAPHPLSGRPLSPDAIFSTDPSAQRLQSLGGDILLYYSANKRMPTQLDDLRSVAANESPTDFTSPKTGQPYLYVQSGLWIASHSDKCIIAYDPTPSAGKRWCLFMSQPQAGAALSDEVVLLPESMFQNYRPLQN